MTWHINIAHKYDVDFHEVYGISVGEFFKHIDRLQLIDGEIVEWHDEENEMAWELNRAAAVNALDNAAPDEDMRIFLRELRAQSNPRLGFMRIEFY